MADAPREGETPQQRRARLAAVFGDPLPEQTRDDTERDGAAGESAGDAWLRAQVPPHHGS